MNTEKPYALFAGVTYYPDPGWRGFRGAFATKEEAAEAGEKSRSRSGWWQVVDLRSLTIVDGAGEAHGDSSKPVGPEDQPRKP